MLGFGWCQLRSSRAAFAAATLDDVDQIDSAIDAADKPLWVAFREWMSANHEPFVQWQFTEHLNNHNGLLTFCVSRNHRN